MVKGWNEVSIAQYKKIYALENDEDWVWNFLAIVENTTYNDIVTRPIAQTTQLSKETLKWATKPPKRHLVKNRYGIGGQVYELQANPNSISTAQYIDWYNSPKDMPENLDTAVSIFLVPEGHKYNDGYDLECVKRNINENMGVEDALTVCDFFSILYRVLIRRTVRMARKTLKKAKKDGIQTQAAEQLLKQFQSTVGWK